MSIRTLPRSFWSCCTMEMWERLAYYGTRVVLPIYIAQADEPGGLHFTQAEKGTIYAWWAIVASGIPMLSGGFADRYGYKKIIALSVTINIAAYLLMANMTSFWPFFGACLLLALGTALFKPGLQGTLAQSMTKSTSSVGWGLFYWLVNVGGAIGPPLAGLLHMMGWHWVFYGCAAITCLNYAMLFTYPHVDSGADKSAGVWKVARDTFVNILDRRLLLVIFIFSGFWMMLYQLWDFMPNFYADWIDSSAFVASNPWLPRSWLHEASRGVQLKQENAINLNSVLIVLFVVPVSMLVARLRVLTSISIGMLIATVGTCVYGTSSSLWTLFLGITLFSVGEMLTGPKKTEYFSLIAPKGKKALYLGYVNIPVAIGQALGAKITGAWYGQNGEKATLALRYLRDHYGNEFVDVKRTEAVVKLGHVLGADAATVSNLLWTTYKPYMIWYIIACVGAVSLLGMITVSRLSRKWNEMNV